MQVLPVARVQSAGVEGWTGQGNPFVFYTLASWGNDPSGEPTGVSTALRARPRSTDPYGDPSIRLAVFDQFEELFTAFPGHWEDRLPFLDDLAKALQQDRRLRMVFVVREDHLADVLDAVEQLPDGLKAQLRLPRLEREEAIEAIEGPVHRLTRLRFAEGVAEDVVNDLMTIKVRRGSGVAGETIGEYVEPVQLQVVCTELWRSLPADTEVITRDHVAKIGDPTSALAHFYDDCVAETSRRVRVSSAFTRRWFERVLITPAGTRATAWQGDRDTAGMPNAAVAELENQHMLRAEDRAGGTLVRDQPRPLHRCHQEGQRRGAVAFSCDLVGGRRGGGRRGRTRRGVLLGARRAVAGDLDVVRPPPARAGRHRRHGPHARRPDAAARDQKALVVALGNPRRRGRTHGRRRPGLYLRLRLGRRTGRLQRVRFRFVRGERARRLFRRRQGVRLRVGSRGRNLHRAPARCPLANGEHPTPEAPTPEDGPAPHQLSAASCGRIRIAGRPSRTRRGGR